MGRRDGEQDFRNELIGIVGQTVINQRRLYRIADQHVTAAMQMLAKGGIMSGSFAVCASETQTKPDTGVKYGGSGKLRIFVFQQHEDSGISIISAFLDVVSRKRNADLAEKNIFLQSIAAA